MWEIPYNNMCKLPNDILLEYKKNVFLKLASVYEKTLRKLRIKGSSSNLIVYIHDLCSKHIWVIFNTKQIRLQVKQRK